MKQDLPVTRGCRKSPNALGIIKFVKFREIKTTSSVAMFTASRSVERSLSYLQRIQ